MNKSLFQFDVSTFAWAGEVSLTLVSPFEMFPSESDRYSLLLFIFNELEQRNMDIPNFERIL